jgi:hypothetical protein
MIDQPSDAKITLRVPQVRGSNFLTRTHTHNGKLVISRAFGSKSVRSGAQGFPSKSWKMWPGITKLIEDSQAIPSLSRFQLVYMFIVQYHK